MENKRSIKLLWVTNVPLPVISESLDETPAVLGGWLHQLHEKLFLNDDIEVAVACPHAKVKGTHVKLQNNNFIFSAKVSTTDVESILNSFAPQIVHIHGTELPHALLFAEIAKKLNIKIVISIQGIVTEIAKALWSRLPDEVVYGKTLRNLINRDSLIDNRAHYELSGVRERLILELADIIIGRTQWDFNFVKGLNQDTKYRTCNEILRSEFYSEVNELIIKIPRTIYFSQGKDSHKGLNVAIEAISLLKDKYPDVRLVVGGDFYRAGVLGNLNKTKYQNYIGHIIKLNDLKDNIKFIGVQDVAGVMLHLAQSHIFLISSTIENSPNSLGEAMMLRLPIVSSNVGGISSMIENNKDGLLFNVENPKECANAIDKLFESDKLCSFLATSAYEKSKLLFDKSKAIDITLEIYKEITGC